MTNPPGWVKQASASSLPIFGDYDMAGIAAGVVAAADVNSQPAQTGGLSAQSPALWANMWVILAFLYLLGVYYGMIRIRARG